MIYRTICLGAFLAIAGMAMAQQVAPALPTPAPAPTPMTSISRPQSLFSLGLGCGPLYGEAGTNLEYHMTGQVSASAGIELNGNDTKDWFVGTSVYLRPEGKGSRPRITLGVGNGDWDDESHNAKLILAVGGSWANAANDYRGFDVDVTTEGSISFGYHF